MQRTKKTLKGRIGKFLILSSKRMKKPFMYLLYVFFLTTFIIALAFQEKLGEIIWRYYWGPIAADAGGGFADGIREGYNPINTLTYGIISAIMIYLIHRLFKKLKLTVDSRLILSLVPIMVLGGLARVLEDAAVVEPPGAYLLISPLIYVWLGTIALFFVLYSNFLERRNRYEAMVLCAIPYPLILRVLWLLMPYIDINEDALWFLLIMAIFSVFHIFFVSKREYERNSSVFLYSMYFLTLMSYYAAIILARNGMPHLYEIPIIFAISLAVTMVFYTISRLTKSSFSVLFGNKINLLMIFSHMFDATATWRGVAYYSYNEKHVFSSFLMDVPYGPFLFMTAKILTILLFIYLLDVAYGKDIDDDTRNLIKMAVVVLGLAPGIRDALRIALGV